MPRQTLFSLLLAIFVTLFGSGCAQQAAKTDASAAQTSLYTPATLIDAVKKGDTALVKKHLVAKVDVNTKDASGSSLLHLAVAAGNDVMVSLLLENKADINLLNAEGFTPLHLAVSKNAQGIITILLQSSAATNIFNNAGYAAIHTATKADNQVVIDMLLQASANDLKLQTQEGLTPLFVAIESGHFKLIKFYLKLKADLNATTKSGLTALQIAMRSNSLKTLDLLIKKGAKLDQVTQDGKTLLHLSAESGAIKIVRFLSKKGLEATLKDKKGLLALDYAVMNAHVPVVQYLLKKSTKLSEAYKFELLKKAVLAKDSKTLLALHIGGVKLDTIQAKSKDSILHFAVTHDGMEPVIEVILKKTDLITHTNAKGLSALDVATQAKKTSYVAVMKPFYLKVQIRQYIAKDDFLSLKALVKKYPEALELVTNKKWQLALNGPEELMIGDLKILSTKGRSHDILKAQINRLKTGYKNFNSEEIALLVAYGIPAPLIAAVVNKTTELEKLKAFNKEKKAIRALQEALLKVEELALESQQKIAKFQEIITEQNREMLQKQDQMIQEQIMTRQAIKSGPASSNNIGNQIVKEIVDKALE